MGDSTADAQVAAAISTLSIQDSQEASSPIVAIPSEVLSHIFVCAMTYDLSWGDFGLDNEFDWKALRLSHVCRYWRDVALDTPRMWTEIRVGRAHSECNRRTNIELVETYVARSKEAPLRVAAWLRSKTSMQALQLVIPAFHRFQWFRLYISRGFYENTFESMSSNVPPQAPLLRTLIIVNHGYLPVIPLFFAQCHPTSLQELHVHGCNIRWEEGLLPTSLTSLQVIGWSGTLPLRKILSALTGLVALVNLELRDILDSQPAANDTTGQRWGAPHPEFPLLQNLKLRAAASVCSQLLDVCNFPRASTRVELELTEFGTSAELVSSLNPILAIGTVQSDLEPVYRIFLRNANNAAFFKRVPDPQPAKPKPHLAMVMRYQDYINVTHLPADSFHILHLANRLQDVTELCIGLVPNNWEDHRWGTLLQSLSRVEILTVAHGSPSAICGLLFSPNNHLILPGLKRIQFQTTERLADDEFHGPNGKLTDFFSELIAGLLRRIKAGKRYTVGTVVFERCPGVKDSRLLRSLEDIVRVEMWNDYRLEPWY